LVFVDADFDSEAADGAGELVAAAASVAVGEQAAAGAGFWVAVGTGVSVAAMGVSAEVAAGGGGASVVTGVSVAVWMGPAMFRGPEAGKGQVIRLDGPGIQGLENPLPLPPVVQPAK